jgi:hypothetical protein
MISGMVTSMSGVCISGFVSGMNSKV